MASQRPAPSPGIWSWAGLGHRSGKRREGWQGLRGVTREGSQHGRSQTSLTPRAQEPPFLVPGPKGLSLLSPQLGDGLPAHQPRCPLTCLAISLAHPSAESHPGARIPRPAPSPAPFPSPGPGLSPPSLTGLTRLLLPSTLLSAAPGNILQYSPELSPPSSTFAAPSPTGGSQALCTRKAWPCLLPRPARPPTVLQLTPPPILRAHRQIQFFLPGSCQKSLASRKPPLPTPSCLPPSAYPVRLGRMPLLWVP